jgi:glucose-1-phosphatase
MKIIRILSIAIALLLSCTILDAQSNLQLEKVVIVSRHGARAPLDEYLKDLATLTPQEYKWLQWESNGIQGSDLTPKGAASETFFGNYFRMYFNSKGFILQDTDVFFGASSKQRTIATARAFAAGLMPLSAIPIEYQKDYSGNYGPLDPDYLPLFNDHSISGFDTIKFKKEAEKEVAELIKSLKKPSYDLLEKTLRYPLSDRAKQTNEPHFKQEVKVQLNFYDSTGKNLEPTMNGDLKIANKASDAFILQYYEMEDLGEAALHNNLSFEEWCQLADTKDYYGKILFTAPIIAVNVSHCMLVRVMSELVSSGHKFSFFCTHDSMIQALLAALQTKEYSLDNTIEKQTPIGFKFVIEQWMDTTTGERYMSAKLIYQSSDQMRNMKAFDLTHPPMEYNLSFNGIEKAPNGYYRYADFMRHLEDTLSAFQATAKGENPFPKK